MAKGVRRLDGAQVRLLLAATLCAGFFIASTGAEEWCSVCYPHAGNDLTIINDTGGLAKVHLYGPVDWDFEVAYLGQKTIRTRVGLYRCDYQHYDAFIKMWFSESLRNFYVSPDQKNKITLTRVGD